MEYISRADRLFAAGFNCAQSSFLPFCAELGVAERQGARLTNCLGGGFSGTGGVCGALSGACLALSGKYGRELPEREGEQLERQETTYRLVQSLHAAFAAEFGSVQCKQLLKNGLLASGAADNEKFLCPRYVHRAVELASQSWRNPDTD